MTGQIETRPEKTGLVEVQGRDPVLAAYRNATEAGRAFVPEYLMRNSLRPGARPSHQDACMWIASHHMQLTKAVALLPRGHRPPAPYDVLTLIETP
jgi:hypothetical protein